MSYVYIRVRNSPAGRVKPIKMKCFNKKQEDCWGYELNNSFQEACNLYNCFLRSLNLDYIYYDIRIFKGVYKNYHYPYVQAYITDKKAPLYDNGYKSKEEVAKYLCKYFWSYDAEEKFIRNANHRDDSSIPSMTEVLLKPDNSRTFMSECMLYHSGILDIPEQRKKVREGNCDLHNVIYDLFCKYLEDPKFITNAIKAKPELKPLYDMFGMYNYLARYNGFFYD